MRHKWRGINPPEIKIANCGHSNSVLQSLRKNARKELNNPNATNEDIELYYTQNPNWRTAKENKSVTGNAIEVKPADLTASNGVPLLTGRKYTLRNLSSI